jgi:hypothetical protein
MKIKPAPIIAIEAQTHVCLPSSKVSGIPCVIVYTAPYGYRDGDPVIVRSWT